MWGRFWNRRKDQSPQFCWKQRQIHDSHCYRGYTCNKSPPPPSHFPHPPPSLTPLIPFPERLQRQTQTFCRDKTETNRALGNSSRFAPVAQAVAPSFSLFPSPFSLSLPPPLLPVSISHNNNKRHNTIDFKSLGWHFELFCWCCKNTSRTNPKDMRC